MSNTLFEKRVLVLNKNWQAINIISPSQAFSMMAADAATGMNTADNCFTPTSWNDWLKLEVRDEDESVGTSRGRVRIPRIIIAMNYSKAVAKKPRLSMQNLVQKYEGKCAYTGKVLKPSERSMEHVVPRSKGGEKSWENIVLADRKINSERGNKPISEAGLKLKVQPGAPRAIPFHETVENTHGFPEWDVVLGKHKKK